MRSAYEEPDFSNQTRNVPDFDLDLSGLVESIGMFLRLFADYLRLFCVEKEFRKFSSKLSLINSHATLVLV